MNLEEKINADIKAAMLARESDKLEALRAIKSGLLLLKTSSEGTGEESETRALQKMVKQRRETAELYRTQGRVDLAEVETRQADWIQEYLPKQMSEDEIRAEVKKAIAETGASQPSEMGKVMGLLSKRLAGRADGKTISSLVKQELGA